MRELGIRDVRRLALARAGLLKPEWTGLPVHAGRGEGAARGAALRVVGASGYLQLDTLSVAGARSQAIVLHSRLPGFPTAVGEDLLRPGVPLFEYWGHAACWMPIELYPLFEFRRRAFRVRSSYDEVVAANPGLPEAVLQRVEREGPLRSLDLDEGGAFGRWGKKPARYVAAWLWSTGQLAIRERVKFHRVYDLPERVIPRKLRDAPVPEADAVRELVRLSLRGHGWAARRTIADTFNLRGGSLNAMDRALEELVDAGEAVICDLLGPDGVRIPGWVRPEDLELAARLRRVRPRPDRGALLSPFDPVLWDRKRVKLLFGFDQVLEIYVPAAKRVFGYFVTPVLAGERLVARVDLKADRKQGRLEALSIRYEDGAPTSARTAVRTALDRFAASAGLDPA